MAERRWLAPVLAAALLALLAWAFSLAQSRPREPEPVAWDRVACARCRMLVGDPAFAAQLHTEAGVLHFDDPGCLLLHLREEREPVRGVWFHAHADDGWIPLDQVRFRRVDHSPMGYGLAAVREGSGPLSADEALARALRHESARGGRSG